MKKFLLITIFLFLNSCMYTVDYDKYYDTLKIDSTGLKPLIIPSYENPEESINLDSFIYNYEVTLKDTAKFDSLKAINKQMEKNLGKIKHQQKRLEKLLEN